MENRTNPKNQGIELGKVTWLRNYDEALHLSGIENKPILLFFQEIPGCSTCVNFGRDVLSHPLMVEFIEKEFIPLAIYNNKPGADRNILSLYNEPSWNNPVAHFINHKGQDIVPKLANNYQPLALYYKMVEVLGKLGKHLPAYAILLGVELNMKSGNLKSTIYGTPDSWSGETSMAQHPAVTYTEVGWINKSKVLRVFFDDSKISLTDLNSYAAEEGFLLIGYHRSYKADENYKEDNTNSWKWNV